MQDKFGDWRISAVTTLAKDVPAAFPGGPSHKAGTPVYQSALAKNDKGENIGFTLPSATAMALNIALKCAKSANKLRSELEFEHCITPDGDGLHAKSDSAIFDFFEEMMIAATFSFQALEVYANHVISRDNRFQGMELKRRKKWQFLSAKEIERNVSTEEKLAVVLPKIRNCPTPKGKIPWESFKLLKSARDGSIHLKYHDQFAASNESLFYRFLNNMPLEFPNAALMMLKHFETDGEVRWLNHFEQKLTSA